MKTKLLLISSFLTLLFTLPAMAQDSYTEAAVRQASGQFVELFNQQDADALARIYRHDAALKLPNSASFVGPTAIGQAWAGGFANGLGGLNLEITHLEDAGWNKVIDIGHL